MAPVVTVGPDDSPESMAASYRTADDAQDALHHARRPVAVVPHD
ncbi:hypothetical protein [Streptomyces sp. NPDC013489]